MAYLSEVKGTAFGRRYELDRDTMVLGRHPDCALILDSGAVSRQHAQIMRREGAFLLKDLGSRNGTYVNGRLISEVTQLHDGDMLRICDLEFSFQDDSGRNEFGSQILQSEGSSLGIMMIDDGDSTSGSRAIMSTLGGAKSSIQGGTVVASAEAKLEALLEITQGLARSVSVDDVLPKVLDSLFRIFVQADRGFIILRSPNGELVPRWVKTRRADDQETVRISRTILREVIEKREAIISLDASHDDRFEMSQSITDFRIRSMIIAPVLNSDGEAIGAIQIDTLNPRTRFESRDLDLLNSVASQAGIAIENAELHEQRLQQRLVEEDLRLATQVQQAFLPSKPMEMESFEFFEY